MKVGLLIVVYIMIYDTVALGFSVVNSFVKWIVELESTPNLKSFSMANGSSDHDLRDFADAETELRRLLESRNEADWIETTSGKSILHVAARSDHGVMEALLANEDIQRLLNGTDNEGATPLIAAVQCDNVSAVRLLLSTGATTTGVLYESRENALHVAVKMKNAECLGELLRYDTSSEFVNGFDSDGNTPLMLSAVLDSRVSNMLLAAGADHLLKNPLTGRNALHVAILESNVQMVETLVGMWCPQSQYINTPDSYGDTPFKLAIRLKEVEIAKLLLTCPTAKEMVWEFPESAHQAVAIGDSELLTKIASIIVDTDELTTWTNADGLTALMVAIEMSRVQSVKDLLNKGVSLTTSRDREGRTILHKAVLAGNVEILNLILELPDIQTLAELLDYEGHTALETALAMDEVNVFAILWKSGIFKEECLNSKSESALFSAAKDNNYGGFLILMLSSNCVSIIASLLNHEVVTDVDLERAYLRQEIYASDFFIMTGVRQRNNHWNFCPPLPDGFHETENGRNLFHACAIGGYVDLLIFLYRYCEIFYPEQCDFLDRPDSHGDTPLLLASECEHREVVKFFLQKGANLCKKNSEGDCALTIGYKSIKDYSTFLGGVLSDFIISDGWTVPEETTAPDSLSIHFTLLCPEGEPYMRVTSSLFHTFRRFNDADVVLHPLIRCFICFMWVQLIGFLRLRYRCVVVNTFVFSTYIIAKNCILFPKNYLMMHILWWVAVICYILTIICSLPLTFLPRSTPSRWFEGRALLLPSLLGLTYLVFFNDNDRASLEIGGWAVLFTWFSLLSVGVASPLRKQNAMYQVVCSSMYPYLPIYFLVTGAFGFYFFVLFNDYFLFNNPIHSSLYAAFQLTRGDLDYLPVLSEDTKPFRQSNASFTITKQNLLPGEHERIDKVQEIRSMAVEGTMLIVFLAVMTAVTNLLTALAVRSGEQIILSGDVYELASQVDRLEKWEMFLFGRICAQLYKFRLLWLISMPQSAAKNFPPPKVIYPLVSKPDNFELFMIKNNVVKRENLISNRCIKFLLEWFYRKDRVSQRSRHFSFNKLIVEN